MRENNLSQLVGALGGWLEARPYGAEQDALDRAARIVLDMRLLGVSIDDVDAPELAALDPEDREVVEHARVWAQARREDASRRERADERAALHRRVAEREAGPSDAFTQPAPSQEPIVDARASESQESKSNDTARPEPVAIEAELQAPPSPSGDVVAATTKLADPDDHDFFSASEPDVDASTTRSLRISPDAAFKVVIVVWGIAALGVLAVLLRLALG